MKTVSDTCSRLMLACLLLAVAFTAQRRGGW